jgi:hypothetical protein
MYRCQQLRNRGSRAAVVRHFEQVRLRLLLGESLLRSSFRIPFQQSGSFSIDEFHDQRLLVPVSCCVSAVRRQDANLCAAKIETISRLMMNYMHAWFGGLPG